jgi:hypothetical protein
MHRQPLSAWRRQIVPQILGGQTSGQLLYNSWSDSPFGWILLFICTQYSAACWWPP